MIMNVMTNDTNALSHTNNDTLNNDGIMEAEVPLEINSNTADTTPSAEPAAELAGQKPGYNDTDSDRIGGYLF